MGGEISQFSPPEIDSSESNVILTLGDQSLFSFDSFLDQVVEDFNRKEREI